MGACYFRLHFHLVDPSPTDRNRQVLVTYQRPFWREQGLSGNGMSYGGGPIQQFYDSCGPEGSEPYALCGFIFGAGADLPSDSSLRPQVRTCFSEKVVAGSVMCGNARELA